MFCMSISLPFSLTPIINSNGLYMTVRIIVLLILLCNIRTYLYHLDSSFLNSFLRSWYKLSLPAKREAFVEAIEVLKSPECAKPKRDLFPYVMLPPASNSSRTCAAQRRLHALNPRACNPVRATETSSSSKSRASHSLGPNSGFIPTTRRNRTRIKEPDPETIAEDSRRGLFYGITLYIISICPFFLESH